MVRRGLRLEQFGAAHLALRIKLANALLFFVGKPRWHWACWHKDGRQMAKAKSTNQQAGNNLVTNAQHRNAFEHAMA